MQVRVSNAASAGEAVPAEEVVEHRPFLLGFHVDAPARAKVAKYLGTGAYLVCGWCLFQGSRLRSARGNLHM